MLAPCRACKTRGYVMRNDEEYDANYVENDDEDEDDDEDND
jgi:hypothetical protein